MAGGPATSFNSRARGGRDFAALDSQITAVVSIHAPVEGATRAQSTSTLFGSAFQFTRPWRARPEKLSSQAAGTSRFQFTRPWRARQSVLFLWRGILGVSIHAPVEGATHIMLPCSLGCMWVSIHAPVEGATNRRGLGRVQIEMFQFTRPWRARRPPALKFRLMLACFNSRARGGRDQAAHALQTINIQSFNSRARGGRDLPSRPCSNHSRQKFQFTRPWRARRQPPKAVPHQLNTCFNSRARGGRDLTRFQHSTDHFRVSIHAPVEGATPRHTHHYWCRLFQFTRPWRARRRMFSSVNTYVFVSIHAPVEGATGHPELFQEDQPVSIHAPVEGATFAHAEALLAPQRFNSRARGGRDIDSHFGRPPA